MVTISELEGHLEAAKTSRSPKGFVELIALLNGQQLHYGRDFMKIEDILIQAYLHLAEMMEDKQTEGREVLALANLAMQPSVHLSPRRLCKCHVLRYKALLRIEGQQEPALIALDRAIAIAITLEDDGGADKEGISITELQTSREKLVANILENREGFVPLPPEPERLEENDIFEMNNRILSTRGEYSKMGEGLTEPLNELLGKRGFLEMPDRRGITLLWACCMAALLRRQQAEVVTTDGLTEMQVAEATEEKRAAMAERDALRDVQFRVEEEPGEGASVDQTDGSAEEQEREKAKVLKQDDPDCVLPLLKRLLEEGCRPNQRASGAANHQHRTCLQLLCNAGATRCVHFLLNFHQATYGVSAVLGDGERQSESSSEAMAVLRSVPCREHMDVNTVDGGGWTALHVAVAPNGANVGKNQIIVALLIAAGAVVTRKQSSGMSPVSLAAQCGDSKSLVTLVKAGAHIDARDASGNSVIKWALVASTAPPGPNGENIKGSSECVEALVGFARGVTTYNRSQWTAKNPDVEGEPPAELAALEDVMIKDICDFYGASGVEDKEKLAPFVALSPQAAAAVGLSDE